MKKPMKMIRGLICSLSILMMLSGIISVPLSSTVVNDNYNYLTSLFTTDIVVYADEDLTIPSETRDPYLILESTTGVIAAFANANEYTQGLTGKSFTYAVVAKSGNDDILLINQTAYNKLSSHERTKVMTYALNGIRSSGINSRQRAKCYSFVENLDTKASRYVTALSEDTTTEVAEGILFLRPGMSIFSKIIGIIITLGMMLLTVQVGIDLIYCVTPLSHTFLDNPETGKARVIVSREAEAAYKESELTSAGGGRDAVWGLFRKRMWPIIAFSVFTLLFLTGNIFTVLAWFMDVVDNVINLVIGAMTGQ